MMFSKKHATFGDVTKLITHEWVQQLYEIFQVIFSTYLSLSRYLEREKKVQLDNTTTFEFCWGERAKHEIDKESMIAFLAEVF